MAKLKPKDNIHIKVEVDIYQYQNYSANMTLFKVSKEKAGAYTIQEISEVVQSLITDSRNEARSTLRDKWDQEMIEAEKSEAPDE